MRQLTLVRHAKSDWSIEASDLARPLSRRGRKQSPDIGAWLVCCGPPVDVALVSPAKRARGTWKRFARHLCPKPERSIVGSLYTDQAADVLHAIRTRGGEAKHLVVVGHNPSLEDFASDLAGKHIRLVTAAIASFEVEGHWDELHPGNASLFWTGRPADIPCDG